MLHNIVSEHEKEHLKLLKDLKNMTIKCFEFCSDNLPTPPVHDNEPIPSTSALNTIVNNATSFDEEHFGTQNKDYLDSEFNVEIIESSISSDNLPDLEITLKDESSDNDKGVTTFRALNADERKKRRRRSRRGKFETDDVASNGSDSN